MKEWSFDLPKGESCDALAVGNDWCVIATDQNYLRFFSVDGIQQFLLSYSMPVVALVAYENLLAIFSHAGVPCVE